MPRLLILLLLSLITSWSWSWSCHAATVTWIGGVSDSGDEPANWDTSGVPTASDDVIISNTVSPVLFQLPVAFNSIKLENGGNIQVEAEFAVTSSITISSDSELIIHGGEVQVGAPITVDGTISMQLGTITAGSNRFPLQLHGNMILEGAGSNHFMNISIEIAENGKLDWESGPLILDSSTITISRGATMNANSDVLSFSDAMYAKSSGIINHGDLVFDSKTLQHSPPTQMCSIALDNQPDGVMTVSGPSSIFRVLNALHQHGTLLLRDQRGLILGGSNQTFSPSSSTSIIDDASLVAESGITVLNGPIIGYIPQDASKRQGTIIIQSQIQVNGNIDIGTLELKGGVVTASKDATIIAHQLHWYNGILTGDGTISIGDETHQGQLQILDPSSTKVLQGAKIRVFGEAKLAPQTTILLYLQAYMQIMPGSTLLSDSQSNILSDSSECILELMDNTEWKITTNGGGIGSGLRSVNTCSARVLSHGIITVTGNGEQVFRRQSRFTVMQIQDAAGVHLQGLAYSTPFNFTSSIVGNNTNSYLHLESARVLFQSTNPTYLWEMISLDADLNVVAPLYVDRITLGSPTTSSLTDGSGLLHAHSLTFISGTLAVEEITVDKELTVQSSASKWLSPHKLTLASGSSNHLYASEIRVAGNVEWKIEHDAVLSIGPGVSLERQTRDVIPVMLVHGNLTFDGQGQGQSLIDLFILLDGHINIINHQPGAYAAGLTGGLRAIKTSTINIADQCSLLLSCPSNQTCVYGSTSGGGRLVLVVGTHEFWSPIDINSLSVVGGENRLLDKAVIDTLLLVEGVLRTHSTIETRNFHYTGGKLQGFAVLGSTLIVKENGQALIDNPSPIALQGQRLVIKGKALWTGKDLTLEQLSTFSIAPTGSLLFHSSAAITPGIGIGGRIENFGAIRCERKGSPTIRVEILNRGTLEIADGNSLTLHSDFTQDSPSASLLLQSSSKLSKPEGDLVIAAGTLDSQGVIDASVQMAGSIVHADTIHGDLILSPSASLSAYCSASSSPCRSTNVSGTSYLSGTALIHMDEHVDANVGETYRIMQSDISYGMFSRVKGARGNSGVAFNLDRAAPFITATIASIGGKADLSTSTPVAVATPSPSQPSNTTTPSNPKFDPIIISTPGGGISASSTGMAGHEPGHIVGGMYDPNASSTGGHSNITTAVVSHPPVVMERGIWGMSPTTTSALTVVLATLTGILTCLAVALASRLCHRQKPDPVTTAPASVVSADTATHDPADVRKATPSPGTTATHTMSHAPPPTTFNDTLAPPPSTLAATSTPPARVPIHDDEGQSRV